MVIQSFPSCTRFVTEMLNDAAVRSPGSGPGLNTFNRTLPVIGLDSRLRLVTPLFTA